MSFSPEELDELLDSQLKILDEANAKILENAKEFHQNHCDNDVPEDRPQCEQAFIDVFVVLFGQKISRRIDPCSDPRHKAKLN